MYRKGLVVVLLAVVFAGVKSGFAEDKDKDVFSIESRSVRRTVSVRDGRLKTVEIKNLLNGKAHKPLEDGFHIIWIPDGDYKKGKKIRLDEKNMKVSGAPAINEVEVKDVGRGGKEVKKKRTELRIPLACEEHPVKVDVIFTASKDDPVIRKRLEVSAPEGSMVLDVEVDRVKFDKKMHIKWFDKVVFLPGYRPMDMRTQSGRPVYAGDFFLGIESPAGWNVVDRNGAVTLRHYPGRTMGGQAWTSKAAVLGAGSGRPNNRVGDAFLKYIDGIAYYRRVHGNRATIVNMTGIRPDLVHRHPVTRSCGGPSHMFSAPLTLNEKVARENQEMDAAGKPPYTLFVSVGSGGSSSVKMTDEYRSFRKPDNKAGFEYAGRCGFAEWFCPAGPNYGKSWGEFFAKLTRENNIGLLHLDYFTFRCTKNGHGHLPIQPYALEACYDGAMEQMAATHRGNPKCINLMSGLWNAHRSPWWLMDGDIIWSGRMDWADGYYVPWLIKQDYNINGHDRYWFDRYVVPGKCFPVWAVSGYCHHGMSGACNARSVKDKSSAEEVIGSAAEVLFGFGRGNVWYIRIKYPSARWKDLNRLLYSWAVSNEEILMAACKPFGGPPSKRKPYGYSHCPENSKKGVVFLRDPFVLPGKMDITLGEELGLNPEKGAYSLIQIFPYRKVVKLNARAGSKVKIDMEGYEAAVYEIYKGAAPAKVHFSNCRYDFVEREGQNLVFDIYPNGEEPVEMTGVKGSIISAEAAKVEKGRIVSTNPLQAQPSASGDFKRAEDGTATIVSGKVKVSIPHGVKAKLLVLAEPGIDLVSHKMFKSNEWGARVYKGFYDVVPVDEKTRPEEWCSAAVTSAGKSLTVETRPGRRHLSSANTLCGLIWQWFIADIPEGEHEFDIKVVADIKTQVLKHARFRVMVHTAWDESPVRVKVKLAEASTAEPGQELPELFPGHRLRTFVMYDDTQPGEVPVRSAKYPVKRVIPKHLKGVIAPDPEPEKPVKGSGININVPLLKKALFKADGALDEGVWKKAEEFTDFKTKTGKQPSVKTRCLVARDKRALYVAVECFGDTASLKAKETEHDSDVWQDDDIELFIDPEGLRSTHYQIIVNSRGTTFDAYYPCPPDPKGDKLWEPEYKSAVKVKKDRWIAEFALPFSIFSEHPVFRQEWGFNVLRSRQKAREYIYLSPTGGAAHWTDRFGTLCGMPEGKNMEYKTED